MSQLIQNYFENLARVAIDILDGLPIERTPQPLDYALQRLSPAVEAIKADTITKFRRFARPAPVFSQASNLGIGLNTVGMLTDRLTILLIKEWCLRKKAGADEAKADALHRTQTIDIIVALANSRPGSSALNTKITTHRADAAAANWEEAFFGLYATNLILWESQEVLYIKDIAALPPEELRDYIRWFSFGNIRRNEYIQLCDEYYWRPVDDA